MAKFTPLGINGAWIFSSEVHTDERGFFTEWFRADLIEKELGYKFEVAQSNISKSKKGVARGIHFSNSPQGQAKWVTCIRGSIWDVVVDLRPDPPTFKKWVGHKLNAGDGQSIFVGDGLGHGFLALDDESYISYLLTSQYNPQREFAINVLDPELNITWPMLEIKLSNRDLTAPSLQKYFNNNK